MELFAPVAIACSNIPPRTSRMETVVVVVVVTVAICHVGHASSLVQFSNVCLGFVHVIRTDCAALRLR